ncbi:MAG TPA: hypothetical protein VJ927_11640 [Actinomycetota bacterium]|nr:hypothetical protein [Actinomycetota bacterium]
MTRNEILRRKRFPKWLVGLMLVGSVFTGVACEADVDADGTEETEDDEGDVDSDVDVDTDVEDDEAVEDEETDE